HNAAFAKEGLNKVYLPFRVPSDKFAESLKAFNWLGVKGYSVTLPHKESVLELTDQFDGPIKAIGAANTLYRDGEGKWRAANTDFDAALQSLELSLQGPEHADDDPVEGHLLSGKKVLMLGAGGVARAIGYGVMQCGAGLMVTNRTKSRAADLAKEL